jgi:predicted TIM-barrel fold metal-dependent hydrolase
MSPDDHLQAPAHLWKSRLSSKLVDFGPRIKRLKGRVWDAGGGNFRFTEDQDGRVGDAWDYDGKLVPIVKIAAAAGYSPRSQVKFEPTTFEEIREGCYDSKARLRDMDTAGILASVNYPNMFVMFAGEQFSFAQDKSLALECIKAYNDYVIEEWCAGSAGRLVPMGIVPLWDVSLAVLEAERLAKLGFHSISFSEAPHRLELPSVSSGKWDPLFAVCEQSSMVLSLHIGTAPMNLAAKDAPVAVPHAGGSLYIMHSLLEYLFSGVFIRYPKLRVCFAESQLGLVPYVLDRADFIWNEITIDGTATVDRKALPEPPSSYFKRNCWVAFFRDPVGLAFADKIGVDRILFETDYPHLDTEWPNCQGAAEEMTKELAAGDAQKILADNTKNLFGIEVGGMQ